MRPVLFEIPIVNFPVHSYGVMLGISFLLGWSLCLRLAEKAGIDRAEGSRALFWTLVFSIVGARIMYFIAQPDRFSVVDFFKIWEGGLVAYGGMIGGTIAAYVALKKFGINFWEFADYASPGIAVGIAVTRIGCFLYGCDFGAIAKDFPLAVRYPAHPVASQPARMSPAFEHHVADLRLLPANAPESLPVHPTQLYEMVAGLLLLGATMLVLRRFRKFYGQVFATLVVGYAVLRFIIEALRDDPQRGAYFGLSTSQNISILTLAFGIALFFLLPRRQLIAAAAANPRGRKPKTGAKPA
ncbi:MAG: prolipoprotein diacylglyceryl transferase [Deltaproteobacteria bacterium]|nr:prolipoprotein diacylglyceryl transferase [Deltaproteobacteria bacterium]